MPKIHSGEPGKATAWPAGFPLAVRRWGRGGGSFPCRSDNPANEVSQDALLSKEGEKKNGNSALSRDSGGQNCQSPKRESSVLYALAEPEVLMPLGRAEVT